MSRISIIIPPCVYARFFVKGVYSLRLRSSSICGVLDFQVHNPSLADHCDAPELNITQPKSIIMKVYVRLLNH